MKTIEIKLYKFNELTTEAQKRAIDKLWEINVDNEYWDCIYYDAAQIGLRITGFDIYRGSYVNGDLTCSMMESIDLIKKNHGDTCDTFKLACEYAAQWDNLVHKYSDGINTDKVAEGNEYEFDNDADELEQEYTKELCECYLSMLRSEYEYFTSEEAIIETIEANDYDFTEDGSIY